MTSAQGRAPLEAKRKDTFFFSLGSESANRLNRSALINCRQWWESPGGVVRSHVHRYGLSSSGGGVPRCDGRHEWVTRGRHKRHDGFLERMRWAAAGWDSSRSDIYYLQQIPARRSLTCSHHKCSFCKSLRHDKASESGDLRWKGWGGEGWGGVEGKKGEGHTSLASMFERQQ